MARGCDIGINYACWFFKVNLLKDPLVNQGASDVYVILWTGQQIAGLDTPVGPRLRKYVSVQGHGNNEE